MVVVITLGAWWWTSGPSDVPVLPATATPNGSVLAAPPETGILVHVAGEVLSPGVVRLEAGARVIDAIEAAGGATRDAVLSAVNLAAEARDGAQIVVPSHRGEPRVTGDSDERVAINTATVAELETLPGVGPVLAGRIVEHREEEGGFDTAEDLLDVPGIGEAVLARLRSHIAVP